MIAAAEISVVLKRSHTWDQGLLMFTFYLGGSSSDFYDKNLT